MCVCVYVEHSDQHVSKTKKNVEQSNLEIVPGLYKLYKSVYANEYSRFGGWLIGYEFKADCLHEGLGFAEGMASLEGLSKGED